jgi:hypothetical protein
LGTEDVVFVMGDYFNNGVAKAQAGRVVSSFPRAPNSLEKYQAKTGVKNQA